MVWAMELLRLRSFVEASRRGSFMAAAQALGYTAPAVSQHVAALERELDCELLIRGPRGVRPTPAGEALQARAERLITDARLAEIAVREIAGQLESLRLGAFPTGAQYLLPDALTALRRTHPDVELTLLHFEPPDGLAEVATGDVDAVLTHRYPGVTWSAPTGVRLDPICSDPLDLLIPPGHRLAGRRTVDIADLRDEAFVSGARGTANRIALDTACAKAHFTPTVAVETAGYGVTAALVAKGFGIAIVPRLACPPASESIRQTTIQLERQPLERHIALAHRSAERSPVLLKLISHLANAGQAPGHQE